MSHDTVCKPEPDLIEDLIEVSVCDGKYTFVLDAGTDYLREIKRHGEDWSKRIEDGGELRYGRAIGALVAELHDARQKPHSLPYTSAMGEAAQKYLRSKGGTDARLPGGFFWCELWNAMQSVERPEGV